MGPNGMKRAIIVISALIFLGVGCAPEEQLLEQGAANVSVHSASAQDIATVVVTVTGSALDRPLVMPLAVRGGLYSALIGGLPIGTDYTFTASARDAAGVALYHGSVSNRTILKNKTAFIVINMNQVTPSTGYVNHAPMIRSMTASATAVGHRDEVAIQAAGWDVDPGQTTMLAFLWTSTCGSFTATEVTPGSDSMDTVAKTVFVAPSMDSDCTVTLNVTDALGIRNGSSFVIKVRKLISKGNGQVLAIPNTMPLVSGLMADPVPLVKGRATTLSVIATDADEDPLTYSWFSSCPGVIATPFQATTRFTLDVAATATACDFTVFVGDGTWLDGSPKAEVANSLTLPVGETVVMTPPVFGTVYQTHDTIAGGDVVGVALVAFDPAGGGLSYSWSVTSGNAPVPVLPTELGLDGTVFVHAARWVAPAGAEDGGVVSLVVSATSSISGLVSRYTVSLSPLHSFCQGQADGENCTTAARGSNPCVLWATCQAQACVPLNLVTCQDSGFVCSPVTGLCAPAAP